MTHHGAQRQAAQQAGTNSTRPRRGRRSLIALAAVGLLACATIVGCSSASGDGVTTLKFMQNKREVVQYFDGVISDFEAQNPDIKVVQDFNEANFVPGLIRDDPPDVVTRGSNSITADFTERGIFADLSGMPVAATVDPNIQQLVNDWGQYNGQTAALPFSLTAAGVIYNKDIFTQYGVAVPTTWDEFVQACETFKANGVTPIYGTFKDGWTINQGAFDYAAGGLIDVQQFYDELNAEGSTVGPDSPVSFAKTLPPVTTAMQQLMSYTQPDAGSRSYSDGNAAFAAGRGRHVPAGSVGAVRTGQGEPERQRRHLRAADDEQPGGHQGPGQRRHGAVHRQRHQAPGRRRNGSSATSCSPT